MTRLPQRRRRLLPLVAGVAVLAAALWALVLGGAEDLPGGPPALSAAGLGLAAALLAGFLLTEAVQLHVEVRRQALSVSLSELPLVLGLFLLPVPVVLACRLAGYLLVAARRRTPALTVAFNAATVTAELAAVALVLRTVADVLPGTTAPGDPTAWLAAHAALLVGTCLSTGLVVAAITRLQGRPPREDVLLMAAPALVTAALGTSVALLVLLVVATQPRAGLLLAPLLGGCVLTYRGYGRLLRRHRSLAQLQELGEAWSRAEGVDDVARALLEHGAQLLRAGHVELRVRAGAAELHRVLVDGTPVEAVAGSGGAALLDRAEAGGSVLLLPRRLGGDRRDLGGLRDAVVAPLRRGDDTSGALLVANRLGETGTFDQADLELVELLARQAAVALQNGSLIDRLRHDATHDPLTGLPNRAASQTRTAAALEEGTPFAVLLMDLDGFKDVNDTLGHHQGDALLRAVALRLRASLPLEAHVARLGGDEFVVLVPLREDAGDEQARQSARDTAALVAAALAHPFLVDGVHLDVRASVGASVFPADGDDASDLLRRADIAMYAAKATGDGVRVYDAQADRSGARRLGLVAELRAAIEHGELECHYQPKLDLRTGEVVGAEALVRWPHPELGLTPPDAFIPVAEQTGLIVPLTMHVLDLALREAAGWAAQGRPLGVAVNVSPRGLLAPGFADAVQAVLARTGTPPHLLTLEITESSVMADPARAAQVLQVLHDVGVRLSVDDFGTGYSSLAYLQRLPLHEVKIDKAFVRELEEGGGRSAIVRAVVDLGHTLGLQVVAEGVEDAAVAAQLRDLGCDFVQGYHYSRPLPPEAFRAWCRGPLVAVA